jgi:hypothetical protein
MAISSSAFAAVGAGADLERIKGARIFARGSNGAIMDFGNIDFVPNPRSKALMVFRADDGGDLTYRVLFPKLQEVNRPGVLAIGDAGHAINGGFHVTTGQVQTMLNAGWQFMSQSLTTEDKIKFDNFTEARKDEEFQGVRALAATFGHRRDSNDMTYFSSVGPNDMIAWPSFNRNGRTIMAFKNWNAGQNPPAHYDEVFPFGDPKQIIAFNLNSERGGANTLSQLQILMDRVRAAKGVLIIAFHPNSDLMNPNIVAAVDGAITEAMVTNPGQWEINTLRGALAPYNGDPLTG